jgi:hypothetical protein
VLWQGKEYKATTDITGGEEGDLSNSPNQSSNWELLTDLADVGQLQKITENGNTGYRIRGRNPDNYGNIGSEAVDLSISNSSSTTAGATSDGSFATGYKTEASGTYSVACGSRAVASGITAISFGVGTKAIWDYTFAEGYYATAGDPANSAGHAAHAEGFHTNATGDASHAEGGYTTASNDAAHAEGYKTTASGKYSHAEGNETEASGLYSHAEGLGTKAPNGMMHVAGKYNVGQSETIHETGIGASDTDRRNAFEIYTDGTLTAPEATISEINSRGSKALVTKEYVEDLKTKLQTANFDATAGQTDFKVTGVIFNIALVYINGVLQRDNSYTISDDGTDTTVTLDTGAYDTDWVSISYFI